MNEQNFLKRTEFFVTGDGFWRGIEIPLREAYLHADGATLTTILSTNPGYSMADTNLLALTWAAGKVVKGGINVHIPGDYDESRDECKVWVLVKSGGSTDTPTLTFEAFKASAPTTDLAPDATAAIGATFAWREVDLDGNSILANETLGLTIVPGTHGTDTVEIVAIKLRYRSDLVMNAEAERSSGTPS